MPKRASVISQVVRSVIMLTENEIELPPAPDFMPTALDVEKGAPILPLSRLMIMSPDEWEIFTLELVQYLKSTYLEVVRCAGAGDKGRDVVAKVEKGWDNYQCKHYGAKLSAADAIKELGKLVYYTWKGDYTLPNNYYFVSPRGGSVDFIDLLSNKDRVRREIISRWDVLCREKITRKNVIELDGGLLEHLNGIDFSFVKEITPLKLIEYHRQTPYHLVRFGSYHVRRPCVESEPPEKVEERERAYIDALIDAFSDADGVIYKWGDTLDKDYIEDIESARVHFFSAEALEVFSRDSFPDGCFKDLKKQCYDSVRSVLRQDHNNGHQRFLKTSEHASLVPYSSHPLVHSMVPTDKLGLCHHLVNDKKIKWVKG